MTNALYRFGKLLARHRILVLFVWLSLLATVVALAIKLDSSLKDNYSLPNTQSQQAQDILSSQFPQAAGTSATIAFQATQGNIADPAKQQYVAEVLKQVMTLQGVAGVSNPYQEVQGQMPNVSKDGTTALSTVSYQSTVAVDTQLADALTNAVNGFSQQGAAVSATAIAGGNLYFVTANGSGSDAESELIGIIAAVVILLIAFGSVVAMGLPLISAILGLGASVSGIYIIASRFEVSSIGPTVAIMIGLGVGIDYALFMVNRYRENLQEGYESEEAVGRTVGTAGQAVIIAGLTVIIALLGLLLIGIPIMSSISFAAAVGVGVAIITANTLLPAMLGVANHGIERFNLHKLFKRSGFNHQWANKWAKIVTKHPVWFGLGALAIFALLIVPVKDMQLGPPGENTIPAGNPQRQVYDIISEKYGPGYNSPFLLVETIPGGQSPEQIQATIQKISLSVMQTSGVAAITPPTFNATGTVAVQAIIPTTDPSSIQTQNLVNTLQDSVLPPATNGSGVSTYIGGLTATFVDMAEKISSKMPLFIATVIGLAFILLVFVFRSLFVPIVAALMIALSALATFGVMVTIFQWGWFKDIIGLSSTGPLVSYVPIMVFAIMFGLSMDYEIFLVSRIREKYTEGEGNTESVVHGVTMTARIIIAAALIMFCVFASFNAQENMVVKMFGTGLAAAILIDVLVARMILVPATLALGKKTTWWMPKWLHKMPDMHFEDSTALPSTKAVRRK